MSLAESGPCLAGSDTGLAGSGTGLTGSGTSRMRRGTSRVRRGTSRVRTGTGAVEAGLRLVEAGTGLIEAGTGRFVSGMGAAETGSGLVGANPGALRSDGSDGSQSEGDSRMAGFMPKQDDQLVTWLVNFQAKIATHGPVLGLTAAQVTALQDRSARVVSAIQAVASAQSALQAAVRTKETSKTTELPMLRGELNQLKANPSITDAQLADLNIVGTSSAFDPDNFRPDIIAEVVSGQVRIKFKKLGADGINLYSRLSGQTAWTFLARDTNSPYDDHRPLAAPGVPETREYQAFGVLKDDQIGQPSAIVSVTFGG